MKRAMNRHPRAGAGDAPGTAHLRDADVAILRAEHIRVVFGEGGRTQVFAVDDVSVDLMPGETLGLVGESGSGKSTVARALLQLPPPTGGHIWIDGQETTGLRGMKLRRARPTVQVVLQDPSSSLNPRLTVGKAVEEPLRIWRVPREERAQRVRSALESVGFEPDEVMDRRPHEFSGGQRQRISLARAIVLRPRILILDEPLSALDVSVQAQIVGLLDRLRRELDLAMIFISHDLAAVRSLSDRIAVLYLGRLCEVGDASAVFSSPKHPYTQELLEAVPEIGVRLSVAPATVDRFIDPPSPANPPSGCRFRKACLFAQERCAVETPATRRVGDDQFVACHFPLAES